MSKTWTLAIQYFAGHTLKEINGVPVAIIGQAFPYTLLPTRHFTTGWTFGIQERELREKVDEGAPQALRWWSYSLTTAPIPT